MYDFYCTNCQHEFEELVTSSNEDKITCPACQSKEVTRKMSAPSPLKTGAFPFKPGPVRPQVNKPTSCAQSCGTTGCK